MGIGYLPSYAYGDEPFHCGYMDTTESQKILQYQRHTFDDYVQEIKKKLGIARIFAIIFRPAIRNWLLNKSPFYKEHVKAMKAYLRPKRKPTKSKRSKTAKKKAIGKQIAQPVKDKPRKTGN